MKGNCIWCRTTWDGYGRRLGHMQKALTLHQTIRPYSVGMELIMELMRIYEGD